MSKVGNFLQAVAPTFLAYAKTYFFDHFTAVTLATFWTATRSLRAADPIAQYQWVDSVYKSLTLNEKIGNCFPHLYPKQGKRI